MVAKANVERSQWQIDVSPHTQQLSTQEDDDQVEVEVEEAEVEVKVFLVPSDVIEEAFGVGDDVSFTAC
jgi:hypothetical protein